MIRYELHSRNPHLRDLKEAAEVIRKGGIVIFPTDTIYALGCLMNNRQGIERICKILDRKEKKTTMSLICPDISTAAKYTTQIDNSVFRLMKKYLPGPYTFILPSNHYVQKFFLNSRQQIGIRIPDNTIVQSLLNLLEVPLISASLRSEDEIHLYYTDPDEIEQKFAHSVDLFLDGGPGELDGSTILDCTGPQVELIRLGKGEIDL